MQRKPLVVLNEKMAGRKLSSFTASKLHQVVGDHTAGVTPVPIPNTEVKPRWADGTARESVWERR